MTSEEIALRSIKSALKSALNILEGLPSDVSAASAHNAGKQAAQASAELHELSGRLYVIKELEGK